MCLCLLFMVARQRLLKELPQTQLVDLSNDMIVREATLVAATQRQTENNNMKAIQRVKSVGEGWLSAFKQRNKLITKRGKPIEIARE